MKVHHARSDPCCGRSPTPPGNRSFDRCNTHADHAIANTNLTYGVHLAEPDHLRGRASGDDLRWDVLRDHASSADDGSVPDSNACRDR